MDEKRWLAGAVIRLQEEIIGKTWVVNQQQCNTLKESNVMNQDSQDQFEAYFKFQEKRYKDLEAYA